MNEEKTTLQKIMEQEAEQMRIAIEQAINEGAKVTNYSATVVVDGVVIVKTLKGFAICLNFDSNILTDKIKPSREQIEAQLKAAEEEVERVKNQLKQYDNETDND